MSIRLYNANWKKAIDVDLLQFSYSGDEFYFTASEVGQYCVFSSPFYFPFSTFHSEFEAIFELGKWAEREGWEFKRPITFGKSQSWKFKVFGSKGA